jgi:hypothetical protein
MIKYHYYKTMASHNEIRELVSESAEIQFSKRQLATARQNLTVTLNNYMSAYFSSSESILKEKILNIEKKEAELKFKQTDLEKRELEVKRIEDIQNAREIEQNKREELQNTKELKLSEILYGLCISESELN